MATRTKAKLVKDVYLDLVRRVPLRPIRSEQELDRATEMMNWLIDKVSLNQDEDDYLDVLSDLIERYETEHYPMIEPVSDAQMLAFLLEAKGVTQAEVATGTGIAESTISEFLSGKRIPNRKHIGKLADYFHVGPGIFSIQR
jgi:HTH-type transcriptional regulator/antitoxin HigA